MNMNQTTDSIRGLMLVLLVVMSVFSFGQSRAVNSSTPTDGDITVAKYPHPYLYGGLQLNGGGYSPTAWVGGAGLDIELAHLVFDASAAYDTGHKTNDNTINNNAGHDRGLDGDLFYRFHKLYVGGGASWSQLSTTNYSKQSWHPNFGVGRDWLGETFSLRGQVVYKLPGSDHLNAAQGPEFSLWMPSPLTSHHFFMRETVGIYMSHATVTDPSDAALTAEQIGNRSVSGFVSMNLLYRF
jgi:hypothetical protein